jgi:hypothetical protein
VGLEQAVPVALVTLDPKLFPVCSFCRTPGGAVYTGRSSPRHFGTCETLGCVPAESADWDTFFGLAAAAHCDGRLYVVDCPDEHPCAHMPPLIADALDVPLLTHVEMKR